MVGLKLGFSRGMMSLRVLGRAPTQNGKKEWTFCCRSTMTGQVLKGNHSCPSTDKEKVSCTSITNYIVRCGKLKLRATADRMVMTSVFLVHGRVHNIALLVQHEHC